MRNFAATASAIACFMVSNAEATVTIIGTRGCGEWANAKNTSKIDYEAMSVWVLGFLNGLAVATDKDVLRGLDVFAIPLWMDKYCSSNPLSNLPDGAVALFAELKKRNVR